MPGGNANPEAGTDARREPVWRDGLLRSAFAPIDTASLAAFRIGFGLIMAWWSLDYLISGRVHELYIVPRFHFTYYLFDFVRPWPGAGMTIHFLVLFVLALCIAAGFLYRAATVLFAASFTYFFLLDRTNYQNHYYLLMLLSWTLAILPLNRSFAVDASEGLTRRSATFPAWCLWLIRFHVGLPYFFGGIAKLHPDWFAGEPMRTHLMSQSWPAAIQPLLTSETTINLLIWGGLLFDLGIVPLLLWRWTRVPAYLLCLGFHLTNSLLFQIHVFPWFMILATTIFFAPNWPRRLFGSRKSLAASVAAPATWSGLSRSERLATVSLLVYCLLQIAIPFRHFAYSGDSMWTERGHHFSWRMMLRAKASALRYYVTDKASGESRTVDLRRYVNLEQLSKFSRDPEMILHLAHHVGDEYRRLTGREVEVRALVLTSLNGRKPELLVDPNVDLTQEPRGFYLRTWIMPQREPLRDVAWMVPMLQWEQHVEIPPLTFLKQPQSAAPAGNAPPSHASPGSPAGTGLAVRDTP